MCLPAVTQVPSPTEEDKRHVQNSQGSKDKGRALLLPAALSRINLALMQHNPLRSPARLSPCRVMLKRFCCRVTLS